MINTRYFLAFLTLLSKHSSWIAKSLVCLLSFFICAMAHAENMDCRSERLRLRFIADGSVVGTFGLSKRSAILNTEGEELRAVPSSDELYGDQFAGAHVVFTEKSSEVVSRSERSGECPNLKEVWKTRKVISMDDVSIEAYKKLGLVQGEDITFECDESTSLTIESCSTP